MALSLPSFITLSWSLFHPSCGTFHSPELSQLWSWHLFKLSNGPQNVQRQTSKLVPLFLEKFLSFTLNPFKFYVIKPNIYFQCQYNSKACILTWRVDHKWIFWLAWKKKKSFHQHFLVKLKGILKDWSIVDQSKHSRRKICEMCL